MPRDTPTRPSETSLPAEAEPSPFVDYILPARAAQPDATFKQLDDARSKLQHDLHCSDKELPVQLAQFELRCAFAGIPKREVIDTYSSISQMVSAENAVLPAMKRWTIGLDLVKNLGDPTKVDQGEFGTCAYSSFERMMYFHKPSVAAKLIADSAVFGAFTLPDGTKIVLAKNDIADDGFRSERGAATHVLDTALQTAALRTCGDVGRVYHGDRSQLHYRQWQDAAGFNESVVKISEGKETFFSATSSNLVLNMTRTFDSITPLYGQVTGDKERPVLIQGQQQRDAEPKLRPSIGCETAPQLHSALTRLKENKQLPVMAAVHTSQEPFWSDSGRGSAPGAGGEQGGWHMVLITDYSPGQKLVSVDNSWGKNVDHLGRTDTKAPIKLDDMLKALNRR